MNYDEAVEKFIQEHGVKVCPPALAEGSKHSYFTRAQVIRERRSFKIGEVGDDLR